MSIKLIAWISKMLKYQFLVKTSLSSIPGGVKAEISTPFDTGCVTNFDEHLCLYGLQIFYIGCLKID
jgi:hypothetical protein